MSVKLSFVNELDQSVVERRHVVCEREQGMFDRTNSVGEKWNIPLVAFALTS